MGVEITEYTDSDAVRASLGVDESDCPDRVFDDSLMAEQLEAELDTWLSTHSAIFSAGVAPAATDDEKRNLKYLRLYSQFYCAYQIAKRPMQIVRTHSDGKARMDRFEEAAMDLKQAVSAEVKKYKTLLDVSVNGASGNSVDITIVGISSPAIDPVTGDGLI